MAPSKVTVSTCLSDWRINSEVLPLQWRQVDLKAGEVRLDPGTTKNLEGRVFYLTTELKKLLADLRKAADRIQRRKEMIVQHVFFHDGITKAGEVTFLAGHAISSSGFYHAWCRARIKAGCPGSIPHDFRRTAIRNMVRAGVPERVAMKLSGHKTRSVFDRYNIVSDGDFGTLRGVWRTTDVDDEEQIVIWPPSPDPGWRVDRYNGSFARNCCTNIAVRSGHSRRSAAEQLERDSQIP